MNVFALTRSDIHFRGFLNRKGNWKWVPQPWRRGEEPKLYAFGLARSDIHFRGVLKRKGNWKWVPSGALSPRRLAPACRAFYGTNGEGAPFRLCHLEGAIFATERSFLFARRLLLRRAKALPEHLKVGSSRLRFSPQALHCLSPFGGARRSGFHGLSSGLQPREALARVHFRGIWTG